MGFWSREGDVVLLRVAQTLLQKKLTLRLNFTWSFNTPVIQEGTKGNGFQKYLYRAKTREFFPRKIAKWGEKIEVESELFHEKAGCHLSIS